MRRKPGALVPLELNILVVAAQLRDDGATHFHGYQIARHIAGATDRRLLTAYGTLYRALGRLQEMGLLESRWEDPQIAADENRPGRRLYALTLQGAALARQRGGAERARAGAVKRLRKRESPA